MTEDQKKEFVKETLKEVFSDLSCDECKWRNEGIDDECKDDYCDCCPGCRNFGWQCCESVASHLADYIVSKISENDSK